MDSNGVDCTDPFLPTANGSLRFRIDPLTDFLFGPSVDHLLVAGCCCLLPPPPQLANGVSSLLLKSSSVPPTTPQECTRLS